jgi:enediyne biosynthesis protein E5
VAGAWDWILPAIIVATGSLLNLKLTRRGWLILGWVGGFAAQGAVRVLLLDHSLTAVIAPVTGLAFVLFTFYMVTDPATTPTRPRNQLFFGLSVAALYGLMTSAHIAFGLFFALVIVCAVRGLYLYTLSKRGERA